MVRCLQSLGSGLGVQMRDSEVTVTPAKVLTALSCCALCGNITDALSFSQHFGKSLEPQ